jgi:hypothetical protein
VPEPATILSIAAAGFAVTAVVRRRRARMAGAATT